jgi:peptide-methionine (S)-S-oxide reductase
MTRIVFLIFALAAVPGYAQNQKATFAAGCFWCTEEAFDKVAGVVSTTSGYMGGKKKHPTYEEVSSGTTGHTEVVQVVYDPAKVSYERLLEAFWLNHDPTVADRQFCDSGSQYRPEIFYHSDEQKRLAEASKMKWEKDKPFRQAIRTPITPAGEFWPAEDYHQDYYKKNPARYTFYVTGCGRYARLDSLWGGLRKK